MPAAHPEPTNTESGEAAPSCPHRFILSVAIDFSFLAASTSTPCNPSATGSRGGTTPVQRCQCDYSENMDVAIPSIQECRGLIPPSVRKHRLFLGAVLQVHDGGIGLRSSRPVVTLLAVPDQNIAHNHSLPFALPLAFVVYLLPLLTNGCIRTSFTCGAREKRGWYWVRVTGGGRGGEHFLQVRERSS